MSILPLLLWRLMTPGQLTPLELQWIVLCLIYKAATSCGTATSQFPPSTQTPKLPRITLRRPFNTNNLYSTLPPNIEEVVIPRSFATPNFYSCAEHRLPRISRCRSIWRPLPQICWRRYGCAQLIFFYSQTRTNIWHSSSRNPHEQRAYLSILNGRLQHPPTHS